MHILNEMPVPCDMPILANTPMLNDQHCKRHVKARLNSSNCIQQPSKMFIEANLITTV
jgi:hypothetical protein